MEWLEKKPIWYLSQFCGGRGSAGWFSLGSLKDGVRWWPGGNIEDSSTQISGGWAGRLAELRAEQAPLSLSMQHVHEAILGFCSSAQLILLYESSGPQEGAF